jgi:chaperonin cofactor prefoldin
MIPPDEPPWGFIEWIITGLSSLVVFIGGYVLRTRSRLNSHENTLDKHEKALIRLEDDSRLTRDTVLTRPTKEDLRDGIKNIQDTLESRFEQFATRFDRLDARIDSLRKQ